MTDAMIRRSCEVSHGVEVPFVPSRNGTKTCSPVAWMILGMERFRTSKASEVMEGMYLV